MIIPGAIKTPTGNAPGNVPTPTPVPRVNPTPVAHGLGAAPLPIPPAGVGRGNPHPHRHGRYTNPGEFTVRMRGGGLPAQMEVGIEEPVKSQPPENSQTLWEDVMHSTLIYGYNGKLMTENSEKSFLKAALRLLEYNFTTRPEYKFLVNVYPNGPDNPLQPTLTINKLNIHQIFNTMIKPHLNLSKDPKARIFVRTEGSDPPRSQIEPCRMSMKDIVRLSRSNGDTSYWKIPKDLANVPAYVPPAYGINQCQPGFFKAMKILFDPEPPRPLGSVWIKRPGENMNLGFGGMEVVVELWRSVYEQAKLLKEESTDTIDFHVDIFKDNQLAQGEIGSHLTGSRHEAKASIANPTLTYDEIENMSKSWLAKRKAPAAIRIWHSAEEREQNHGSKVIQLKPKETAIDSLKNYFEGWEGRTNCCWWRPEFDHFTVEALWTDPPVKEVQWAIKPHHQTLKSFRNEVNRLTTDPKDLESFILVDAQSESDHRRFVVTKNTTEEEWRMHIYDWLHSEKLFIRKSIEIPYGRPLFFSFCLRYNPTPIYSILTPSVIVLNQKDTFGISPPMTAPASFPPKPTQATTGLTPDTNTIRNRSTRNPLAPRVSARWNKERIVAAAAGKPKLQKWADWMTEQYFQDGLQRKSWIKDQSVVEPGRMPAPPLFGPSCELQMRVGSSMPTIYAQRLTPTDIKQLQDENQKLRNQVLDRIFACPICNEEFETYEKDKIRDHVRQHQKQLEEAGNCPSCGDPQWVFMTNDEKRMHFATHQYNTESAKVKHFYQDQHCPVCDRGLSKMKPEEVIHHCLDHAPGQVQYCDRCGLDEKDCTTEELRHHRYECRLAEDRQAGEPEPTFCKNCGEDQTCDTVEEFLKHQKHYWDGSTGRFCTKCRLNMTAHHSTRAAINKHDSHCMLFSGVKKKFCEKCRTEVFSLDEIGKSHHHQNCHQVEPTVPSEQSRIIGMSPPPESLRQASELERELTTLQNLRNAKTLLDG